MTDMNRLGVFKQPGSIDIGDTYEKQHKLPNRYQGKQFLNTGSKLGKNPDALIDHAFKRLSEGDQFVDPGAHERKSRAALKASNVSEKPFYPSKPALRSTGKGTQYGCIGTQYSHQKEYDEEQEKADARKEAPKNFYTNPPKKGSYGVPGTTIGKREDLMEEPYLVSRELEKVERKVARERIPKAFQSTHKSSSGLFDNNIYAYNPGDWTEKPKSSRASLEKAFRPTHPGKQGFNCTIQKFPDYKEDPLDEKMRREREERAAERAKKGIFKPNSGFKSRPNSVINPLDVTGPNPVSLVDTLF